MLPLYALKCQESFEKLQEIILHQPALKIIDFEKELYLITDASKVSICGIQKSCKKICGYKNLMKIFMQ